jgi:nitroimidazol reductase NimA-like FMN-containing flavoprotein (pyridoxamine 5'-phosphate oxidase superfamily)
MKRLPERADYDRESVYRILDEGIFCHLGFVQDGQPYVIPTNYGRRGDELIIHGSAASRMLRHLEKGVDCCVTVTLLDGLVLARSAFHHSVNYRSVVILGRATTVDDPEQKMEMLRCLTEHIVPGRWDEIRPPNQKEMRGTTVLTLPLAELSAKVRMGPPADEEEDMELPVWAGVVPYSLLAGVPEADPELVPGITPPRYATHYRRPAEKDMNGHK